MNIWENTVLTDKGTALQAKLVNGQTLHVTKVMTGGAKVPVVNLRQQTSVTDGGGEITLQPVRVERDKTVLPVLLENTGLEEGYDLWQVGIYAQDPDEGEILYCIAQASKAKHVPSQTEGPGFSITWDFCFKTSNTAPFDVNLNSVGLVNIEQFQVHTGEINGLKSSIASLDRRIEELNVDLINTIYPVGSIYITTSNINPSVTFLNTSWEQIKDKFLLSAGTAHQNGSTGGSETVTLTTSQIPSHTHTQNAHSHGVYYAKDGYSTQGTRSRIGASNNNDGTYSSISVTATNNNTGGGQSHNNMPPYLTVFVWKRIA